jgi:DNA-binding beta-propeller fold protein YncE
MLQQLEFKASNAVRAALSDTGRTEDVRFSPDNRRLVLAGFGLNHLLILRIAIESGSAGPTIVADDFMELTSDGITDAHGVDFIDERTLAVANRDGLVSIVQIPSGELGGRHHDVEPIREISGGMFCRLNSPGSVAARREPGGRISLLVCNNYIHRVTRHVIDPAPSFRIKKNSVLLERGLDVPDGIAVSHDGKWIAVSNHGTHEVMLFDTSAPLGPYTEPAGVLTGVGYPHGVRFTPDDRHLLVADAGAPVIHVYERGAGWAGSRDPVNSAIVLDEETFGRGRANPEEGGPKGIDIDRSGKVVAATCEEQALAFFSLADVTGVEELSLEA